MAAAKDQRILITGAGGFVGRWLADELRGRLAGAGELFLGARDAADRAALDDGVVLDLRDAASVERVVAEIRPTAVAHLAAVSAVSAVDRDVDVAWDINVMGAMRLARAVMRHAAGARFVHVSTGDVYGGGDGDAPINEAAPLAPRNMYAVTKASSDLLIGQMAGAGLNATRFRPFNHTGPGQTADFVVAAFASQIAEIERGEKPPVIDVGNLNVDRDFCDVRDIVKAYASVLTGDVDASGRVINLASGSPRRIGAVLDDLLALSTARIELRADAARMRAHDTPRIVVDASLAHRLLGWRPKIAWEQTLADVLNYWRARRGAQPKARSAAGPGG